MEKRKRRGASGVCEIECRFTKCLRRAALCDHEVGAFPPASNHIPSRTKTVSGSQWKTYLDKRSNLDKPDSLLKAFVRPSADLQAKKLIGIYVWLAK